MICYQRNEFMGNNKIEDLMNEYYRKNPPEFVFDDLGIHHEPEVPLPAKYEKLPCFC